MSRGGRGGGNHFGIEIDDALTQQMASFRENGEYDDSLYPPMKVHMAPPPTAAEKKLVNVYRKHRTAMRNGPLFIDEPKTGKRNAADFNAFEDVATYGNKMAKRNTGLPNLKKVPIVKEMLPKELWEVVSDGEEEAAGDNGTKKNLTFLKKKRLDKLAQFDEGADTQAAGDDDDDAADADEDDEDDLEIPEDDDFSEDESDLGNDYNAEKYFDDGDGVDDDGDDAGGDDACWVAEQQVHDLQSRKELEDNRNAESEKDRGTHWSTNVFCEKSRAYAASLTLERRLNELSGEPKEKEVPGITRTWEQIANEGRRPGGGRYIFF